MSYVDYETQLSHPCDRGAFVTARGTVKDALVALAVQALKANFVATAPPDALTYVGSQRSMERYAFEDREAYRARLARAWEFWSWSGTDYGVQIAVESIGFADVTVVSWKDWCFDQNTAWWSRFWVVLDGHPFGIGPDGYWDDPGVWDDGGAWDGDGDPVLKNAVLSQIQKFKAAHAVLVEVIVPIGGRQWGRFSWGDGSKWGGSSYRWSV